MEAAVIAAEPSDVLEAPTRCAAPRRRPLAKAMCVICQEEKTCRAKWLKATGCDHSFCAPCIQRWAESCSQCPLCKTEMGSLVPANLGGSVAAPEEVAVPQRRLAVNHDDDGLMPPSEDEITCEACGCGHAESVLMLCDLCDCAYHTYCLLPSLPEVPTGTWYCPCCSVTRTDQQSPSWLPEGMASRSSRLGRPAGRASFLGDGPRSRSPLRTVLSPVRRLQRCSSMRREGLGSTVDAEYGDPIMDWDEIPVIVIAEDDVSASDSLAASASTAVSVTPLPPEVPTPQPVPLPSGGFRRLRRMS